MSVLPREHKYARSAAAHSYVNQLTAVTIKTIVNGKVEHMRFMTFKNITNSGSLRNDYPEMLDDNQIISEIEPEILD